MINKETRKRMFELGIKEGKYQETKRILNIIKKYNFEWDLLTQTIENKTCKEIEEYIKQQLKKEINKNE